MLVVLIADGETRANRNFSDEGLKVVVLIADGETRANRNRQGEGVDKIAL